MGGDIIYIESITEAHRIFGLPNPKHQYVSFLRHKDLNIVADEIKDIGLCLDLYLISLKERISGEILNGRKSYDFQEGTMIFIEPNQVFSGNMDFEKGSDDWILLFDPDYITKSEMGMKIDRYHFFSYDIHEALDVSESEKKVLTDLALRIDRECKHVDEYSQEIILANLECLLKYCHRYFERQFRTRFGRQQDYIFDFERMLKCLFEKDRSEKGIPTVRELGEALNITPYYLSDMLKNSTGKTAKEHIDVYLLKRAKMLLKCSKGNISEIAYQLGFLYPNHFSKFFKSKTGMSPKDFRKKEGYIRNFGC